MQAYVTIFGADQNAVRKAGQALHERFAEVADNSLEPTQGCLFSDDYCLPLGFAADSFDHAAQLASSMETHLRTAAGIKVEVSVDSSRARSQRHNGGVFAQRFDLV